MRFIQYLLRKNEYPHTPFQYYDYPYPSSVGKRGCDLLSEASVSQPRFLSTRPIGRTSPLHFMALETGKIDILPRGEMIDRPPRPCPFLPQNKTLQRRRNLA
ncbi:hypothetical protein QQF64_002336 [Cirrhinus molitorella]|uniref:Uncharacterized protein n=1 Tax=Cirrhinus molitorella TaxID=172907 RepID=A0ABR3MPU5_9TELE